MSFKKEVTRLIDNNFNVYTHFPDRLISDYNLENELNQEYNGRQLLELLQNADDAKSPNVMIHLDRSKRQLSIMNQGEPFDINGIKSLLIAHLSSKTKTTYIGNKGLGFRSILNWAQEIRIYTNGCRIRFSKDLARTAFEALEIPQQDKLDLLKQRELSTDAVPFPVLGCPEVQETSNDSEWDTEVQIIFLPEFEEDISRQMQQLDPEILLFLPNIKSLHINDAVLPSRTFAKEKGQTDDELLLSGKAWKTISRTQALPEDYQNKTKLGIEAFRLTLAYQDELLGGHHKLYNFFPTEITIELPCIIHGTFELNSSRNHLNDTPRNIFILEQLVELLKATSLKMCEEENEWMAFKFIASSQRTSDSKLIGKFYKDIFSLRDELPIYPCVNGHYRPLNEVKFHGNEFSQFVLDNFPEYFPDLVLPVPEQFEPYIRDRNQTYSHEELLVRIRQIPASDFSLESRAELIRFLSSHRFHLQDKKQRFSLLLNDSNPPETIPSDTIVFTPNRRESKFAIPREYVKLDFMNNDLYELLLSKLEPRFTDWDGEMGTEKPRQVQRLIRSVVNLQPYDANAIIDKIIVATRDQIKLLKNNGAEPQALAAIVKQMFGSLFENFQSIDNKQDKLKKTVPLLNENGEIRDSSELFMPRILPTGKITTEIYGAKLDSGDFAASHLELGIVHHEQEELMEPFFFWLGVNKFARIEKLQIIKSKNYNKYLKFIFSHGTPKPPNFREVNVTEKSEVSSIVNLEQIISLPLTMIVLLARKDPVIHAALELQNESLIWPFNRYSYSINPLHSYIQFQFAQTEKFNRIVVEDFGEELNKIINGNQSINVSFLKNHGISDLEAKATLVHLGAKATFDAFSSAEIYEILSAVEAKDNSKEGKGTQTLYKMALDALVNKQKQAKVPDSLKLFANCGEQGEYLPVSEIYYSDNKILPQKVLSRLHLLNLPKRTGESNVEKNLGVKSLKTFEINIHKSELQTHEASIEFNKLFETIKPLLLAYRLKNLKSESTQKKADANAIKNCSISLVRECRYTLGDNHSQPIDENEFINSGNQFFYKIIGFHGVEKLRKDTTFSDAFAEILSIVFKVNDQKNEFRNVLRNDIGDTKHLIEHDHGKKIIEDAYRLLGIPREEIEFWRRVFTEVGISFQNEIKDGAELKQVILDSTGWELPSNYSNVDFEDFKNSESISFLQQVLKKFKLLIEKVVPDGIEAWHFERAKDKIDDLSVFFKRQFWKELTTLPQRQSEFIRLQSYFTTNLIYDLKPLLKEYKYSFQVPFQQLIEKVLSIKSGLNITLSEIKDPGIRNLYLKLLQTLDLEEGDLDSADRSLLYFEGNSERLREKYQKRADETSEDKEATPAESTSAPQVTMLDGAISAKPKIPISGRGGNGSGGWIHTNKSDGKKKKKGKEAELLVFDALVKKYDSESVKWVSGNSDQPEKNDGLHYDIKYKAEDGIWKLVEVKSFDQDFFFLSHDEKEEGLAQKDRYEMALVRGNKVFWIRDFFQFPEGERFEENGRFWVRPSDYLISLNLTEKTAESHE